jgi:hypothetical protein
MRWWQIGRRPASSYQSCVSRPGISFARADPRTFTARPDRVSSACNHSGAFAPTLVSWEGQRREVALEQIQVNVGVALGFGLIGIGLTVLLIALGWSATRRLRNLSDDPRITRIMIVAGLILAAVGVIVGALTVSSS